MEQMKITVIYGQNHKGSTYHLTQNFLESFLKEVHISSVKEGEKTDETDKTNVEKVRIQEFFLPKDLNHFCNGCYACVKNEAKCPFYEEKSLIMKEVEDANLLIFATPNYCMGPTASMKAFLDLTFTYWMSHKPRKSMFYKRALVFATTAGAGVKQAMKPIEKALFYWGVPSINTYGISVQAMNWEMVAVKKKQKIQKDMNHLAKKMSRDMLFEKQRKVPLRMKALFFIMIQMQKKNLGSSAEEKSYWSEQGWLNHKRPWKSI